MKKLLGVIFLVGIIALGAYFYWQTTPDYTLNQIKAAIKQRDTEKFKEYVDVHNVAASIVDGVVSEPVQSMMGGNFFGKMLFAGLMGFVKPEMTSSFESSILEAVKTGSLKAKGSADGSASAGPTFNNVSGTLNLSRKKFRSIQSKTENGDSAMVGLLFVDQDTRSEFVLNCKMTKTDATWPAHWRIVSIENCGDVMLKLSENQGERQRIQFKQEEVEIN